MPAPTTHLDEGLRLTGQALVDLFELQLSNVVTPTFVRATAGMPGQTTTWDGKVWEHVPIRFTGFNRSADAERSRPSLTVVNPDGAFNQFARAGNFDRAFLVRYRVLKAHLDAGVVLSHQNLWVVSRVTNLTANQGLSVELRSLSDGPDNLIPARKFMPDAGFPFVSLR